MTFSIWKSERKWWSLGPNILWPASSYYSFKKSQLQHFSFNERDRKTLSSNWVMERIIGIVNLADIQDVKWSSDSQCCQLLRHQTEQTTMSKASREIRWRLQKTRDIAKIDEHPQLKESQIRIIVVGKKRKSWCEKFANFFCKWLPTLLDFPWSC